MSIKDFQTLNLIDKLSDSFNTALKARFIRNAYESLDLSYTTRNAIDSLTRENAYYRANGYSFNELYNAILALGEFIYKARTEIIPNIKFFYSKTSINETDKLREEMAAENLPANIDALADQVHALYIHIVNVDKETHTVKTPVYQRIPELAKLGQLLTENTKGLLH